MEIKEMFFDSSMGLVFVDRIADKFFVDDGPCTVGANSGVSFPHVEIQPLSLEDAVIELVRRLGEERKLEIRERLTESLVKTET